MELDEIICFDTDINKLPLFSIDIGRNYMEGYIMKNGGGIYLEKHERPHFYMKDNKSASGYICFAKECTDGIYISAFEVPYRKALYVPDNIIHNDCFLVGKYNVIYSKTPKYTTLKLVNKDLEPIKIKIIIV